MSSAPRPLAYVFFHAPGGATPPSEYESALGRFHGSLARSPPDGFLGSASYRVSRTPWIPVPFGPVVYEDWYLLNDWTALGRLTDAAVEPPHGAPHDAVAGQAAGGVGTVLRWRLGAADLGAIRFEHWSGKPRGVPSETFARQLAGPPDPRGSVWQRQLALGPAPEFCRRSVARPPDAPDPGVVLELRPVPTIAP